MDNKDIEAALDEPFNVPDLATVWSDILRQYEEMGFQIPLTDQNRGGALTDNEMITEFQWIYGQYRKYIGTKKKIILSYRGDFPAMLETIKDMAEKDSETPNDRPKLIYQVMRNQWLIDTWNHMAWIYEQVLNDEEGDDDGWSE